MIPLTSLWLSILLAAIFTQIAGVILRVAFKHHNKDWKGPFPDEAGFRANAQKTGLAPGQYAVPHCADMKQMNSPDMQQKMKDGPVAVITVGHPGLFKMGPHMGQQFAFHLVVSILVAYVGAVTLGTGALYLNVFQVTGTAAILAYAAANVPGSIWFFKPWDVLWRELFDGIVLGLVTAGAFGAFWPR
ncbi:MAG: hypothetical protein ACHQXA_05790 [Gemmatimonadales bacterium]